MKIETKELRDRLVTFAEQAVSADEAEYYADEIIEAHIRKSPRTDVLTSAISDIEASLALGDANITRTVDLPSYVAINFHGRGPLTFIKQIHDDLESRAHTNGIAMTAFTNGKSMHTLHAWIQGLAKRGLVALAICNGGPNAVAPFNGTRGLLGTNPLAYGLPGKDGEIFCVDMATSEIPFFEFTDSLKSGEPLKERVAVDQDGAFTTDAKAAVVLDADPNNPITGIVPVGGGYKGYYIVYLMEVLTSALIGMPSSPEMSAGFVPEEHGAVLVAMSPKAFGTAESFDASLEALHKALKAQKPKEGEEIVIPGERNNQRFTGKQSYIEIDDSILKRLTIQN